MQEGKKSEKPIVSSIFRVDYIIIIIIIIIIIMWNVKTRVIPVIIGATGTISKSFRKYVSNITGNHEVRKLQKTAILGTAHILRKVLT
jgi:Sec-independent protein translocase protein TatA